MNPRLTLSGKLCSVSILWSRVRVRDMWSNVYGAITVPPGLLTRLYHYFDFMHSFVLQLLYTRVGCFWMVYRWQHYQLVVETNDTPKRCRIDSVVQEQIMGNKQSYPAWLAGIPLGIRCLLETRGIITFPIKRIVHFYVILHCVKKKKTYHWTEKPYQGQPEFLSVRIPWVCCRWDERTAVKLMLGGKRNR